MVHKTIFIAVGDFMVSASTYVIKGRPIRIIVIKYIIGATMLLLSRMILGILLAVVIQFVNGYQNIVHVSELISEESFIASDKCYVYGNCFLDQALANLTSNTLINITTDVTLSSLVRASDIENVQ